MIEHLIFIPVVIPKSPCHVMSLINCLWKKITPAGQESDTRCCHISHAPARRIISCRAMRRPLTVTCLCLNRKVASQKAADFARVGWSSKERATASQFHAAPHIWILGSLLSVFFWAVTFQLHIWSFYKGFRVSNPPPPQTTRSPCGGRTITDNFSLISYEGLRLIPFNPSAICSPVRCVRD